MRRVHRLFGMLVVAVGIFAGGALMLSTIAVAQVSQTAADVAPRVDGEATATAPTNATVVVAHYAPFAGSVVDTSVAVRVNGTTVITDLVFGERIAGIALPAGLYTIDLVPTGTITPALTVTATVADDQEYTLAAIGGANGWPLDLLVLENDWTPLPTAGKIRLTHLAPFAPTAAATAIDVCTGAGTPITGLTNIAYGDSTGYVSLPPGIYDWQIAAAGTNCSTPLNLPPFSLAAGQVADTFAIGLLNNPELPLQLSESGLVARVAAAHFAPFASAIVSTSVSVRLAGTEVFTGFTFGQLSPYVEVPLGTFPLEIIPTGETDPVLTSTLLISGFVDFTVAAIGDGINQPLAVLRIVNDNTTPPPAGSGRLQIAHLAPIDDVIANTAVDLCAAEGSTPLLTNLTYGTTTTLTLPAGTYTDLFLGVPTTGCTMRAFTIPPFAVSDGGIAYIYALGNNVTFPFSVFSVPDLTAQQLYLPIVVAETVVAAE